MVVRCECLVIGGGAGGLMLALKLAQAGKEVAICSKQLLSDSSTWLHMGGLSAVPLVDGAPLQGDDFKSHIRDTLRAGAGLCNREVVERFVADAYRAAILPLINAGIPFTMSEPTVSRPASPVPRQQFEYSLQHEPGHSAPRIFHCGNNTGQVVMTVLIDQLRALPNVRIYERHMAIDLLTQRKIDALHFNTADGQSTVQKNPNADARGTDPDACIGAYVLDIDHNRVEAFCAAATFLATGGCGRVYTYTSSPDTATGDGIAMYFRLGYPVANMEFTQFHPTCLYNPTPKTPDERRVLIAEALRGKATGGKLVLTADSTEDLVLPYSPLGSAAGRDVVALAIDTEMKKHGLMHVYLNATPAMTGLPAEELIRQYPEVYHTCLAAGVDFTKEPIPVVPAAHFTCGGIPVDEHGCTAVPRLYAVGQTSCTGLHGASRLPNSSLTESILWALQASQHALNHALTPQITASVGLGVPEWQLGRAVQSKDEVQVAYHWDEVRRLMWNLVGIARTGERLLMAKKRIEVIREEIHRYYWHYMVTMPFLELRNIALVAEIIINSALRRAETRGVHVRIDCPEVAVGTRMDSPVESPAIRPQATHTCALAASPSNDFHL
jgi:L-aspartate oxidase